LKSPTAGAERFDTPEAPQLQSASAVFIWRQPFPLGYKLNVATFSNGVIRRRPTSEGFLLFTTNLQPVNNWLTAMGDNGY
jgi:hypothetical protein